MTAASRPRPGAGSSVAVGEAVAHHDPRGVQDHDHARCRRRAALIVAPFVDGSAAGQGCASRTYGAFLALVYVLQTVGELCLSPIGLSMVTKLAPLRHVCLAMGGWFLPTAIGNNLSGIFAGHVSGERGMTVASALAGFTFRFWLLLGAGGLLLLIAPRINQLMHGCGSRAGPARRIQRGAPSRGTMPA